MNEQEYIQLRQLLERAIKDTDVTYSQCMYESALSCIPIFIDSDTITH